MAKIVPLRTGGSAVFFVILGARIGVKMTTNDSASNISKTGMSEITF
jgi:hypothetical protein